MNPHKTKSSSFGKQKPAADANIKKQSKKPLTNTPKTNGCKTCA